MKIKEVADRLKISARAIRFYEEKGLITPTKGENSYRYFSEKEIWRLQTIIALREAGMPVEDIRKALQNIEGQDNEELQYYLELQRSVLFTKWVEIKHIIDTTDYMIDMVKKQQVLPLNDIYTLAEGSRRLREHRSSWEDKWDFDARAEIHDEIVLNEASEYKDYGAALALTVQWLAPIHGEKGLDIGTGTGNLAEKLIAHGAIMAGVDQSKEMLKLCRLKLPALETKLGNFLAIPYLDHKFDFVVSSFAFHHLTESQQALAIEEMRRVLKPHGRICITDCMIMDEDPTGDGSETRLIKLFETKGYLTKHQRINERLHIVYAVPIR
ncbi:MerR family transcriptional regulator [Paenibacillus wynnii]|uniref:MerR family transcriptional regulator n=1 Tax=Paenibacillus wynnii TaxID=268407 RepID=UPI00278CB911|nr:MerR family transcriptional regulator [Paenibacillus wynnii]MDQ0191785.1 putative AdoMet-dependent methyltransferase [Paenibacillus wynnii]